MAQGGAASGGNQQPQNLSDGLKKVHSALADLKLSPQGMTGPGGQFIDGMMQAIQHFVAQQAQATIGGGQGGNPNAGGPQSPVGAGQPGSAGPGGGGASPFGAPPSLPMMGQGGGPAGGPASMLGLTPTPDSMDEISRMLNAGSVNP